MSEKLVDEVRQDIPQILDGDRETLVCRADEIGKLLAKSLSTSQIRNIFYEVKGMQFENIDQLHLLRPKLAYLAGRHGKRKSGELSGGIVILQKILDEAILQVLKEKSKDRFSTFKDFFEAILAYHKYYGGTD